MTEGLKEIQSVALMAYLKIYLKILVKNFNSKLKLYISSYYDRLNVNLIYMSLKL